MGRIVGPDGAAAAGFLDQLVESEHAEATALARAEALASLTDDAYRGSLRAVWGSTLDRIAEIVAARD